MRLFVKYILATVLTAPITAIAITNSDSTVNITTVATVVRFVTEFRNERFKLVDNDYCTGVILNSQTVLTAAHCFTRKIEGTRKTIRVSYKDFEAIIDHSRIFLHPGKHDLAIVKQNLPSTVQVQLPNENRTINLPLPVLLVGFGSTAYNTESKISIDIGELRTGANTLVKFYEKEGLYSIDQANKPGICKGDSGSPALVETAEGLIVVGIANSVEANKNEVCNGRGFFTDIKPHLQWIRSHILR